MEYMWIQVHKMFCEVTAMLVQTQLLSMVIGEPLVKFQLKKPQKTPKNPKTPQDLQITLHAFGCPIHPGRCSSSQYDKVC